jgi:hypothetical protein
MPLRLALPLFALAATAASAPASPQADRQTPAMQFRSRAHATANCCSPFAGPKSNARPEPDVATTEPQRKSEASRPNAFRDPARIIEKAGMKSVKYWSRYEILGLGRRQRFHHQDPVAAADACQLREREHDRHAGDLLSRPPRLHLPEADRGGVNEATVCAEDTNRLVRQFRPTVRSSKNRGGRLPRFWRT